MNTKVKNFLRGVGSVMDLSPTTDLRNVVAHRSGAERMASHFIRVGQSIGRSCDVFEDNGKTTSKKTKVA